MTAHVIPRDDLIGHEANKSCVCGPTDVPIEDEDGSMMWILKHNSLDGREMYE